MKFFVVFKYSVRGESRLRGATAFVDGPKPGQDPDEYLHGVVDHLRKHTPGCSTLAPIGIDALTPFPESTEASAASIARTAHRLVDLLIDRWHSDEDTDKDCPLHEYLGWTEKEYARYVETNKVPGEEG